MDDLFQGEKGDPGLVGMPGLPGPEVRINNFNIAIEIQLL